jgi:hypothetical protein
MDALILGTVDLSGVSLPFTVSDMVNTGMELIGIVGPFVLLGLALMFAPRLINFVKRSFGSGGRRV